jgi:hypothetical protein
VVVSIDEKSQIPALDRTPQDIPLKRGKCATLTHDYKGHGATTLFAALSVLDGKVIGRCVPRHRHQEFIRFTGESPCASAQAARRERLEAARRANMSRLVRVA